MVADADKKIVIFDFNFKIVTATVHTVRYAGAKYKMQVTVDKYIQLP